MPGLVLTLGGRMDASLKGVLAQSVAEGKAAGAALQASLNRQEAMLAKAPGSPNATANVMANESRLAAEKIALAKNTDLQILASNRAAGVQLTLAESLRLKAAGMEYRSLAVVAAEAEAAKVAANKAAMDGASDPLR